MHDEPIFPFSQSSGILFRRAVAIPFALVDSPFWNHLLIIIAMESLVDDNVLAQALPALLMAGGVAAAVVMQCGKSRTVKQKKRPGKGGSRKSRKGSRKGSRKVSKKSGKSKRESKKHGHKVVSE